MQTGVQTVQVVAEQSAAALPVEPTTWWGKVTAFFESFQLQYIADTMGGSAGMMRVGMWFGAGFVFGFLFKKYFKFTVATLFVAAIMIVILQSQHVLVIDWVALKKMIGLAHSQDLSKELAGITDVIKQNAAVCVAGTGGFLVGHQLG